MADEVRTLEVGGNSNVPIWQTGIASAINDTYSFANNSLFVAMCPTYYRDYMWRYVRVSTQWLDGYVWRLHNGQTGIVSTRIGSKLITGLSKQIVGEKITFKQDSKDKSVNGSLEFISNWAKETNVMKPIYSGIGFALACGSSLMKINKTMDGKLWWEAVRLDNCFFSTDYQNNVNDATFLIRGYTDTRPNHSNEQFMLVEHRYYQKNKQPKIFKKLDGSIDVLEKVGELVPYIEYNVYRCQGTVYNNLMPQNLKSTQMTWSELPREMRDAISHDYNAYRLNEPIRLPFKDLGVEVLVNAEIDLSVPQASGLGESLLVGIQDDMLEYELASSYLIRDMYLGKGTVYQPKSTSMGDLMSNGSAPLNGIGDNAIELMDGVDPEKQKIVVNQFATRGAEWQTIKENALKNIAAKWHIAPKLVASYLAHGGGGTITATQVNSEDDISVAFIYHTRSYFMNALNKLFETTLNFYGKVANIKIAFASPSLINKDRLIARVLNELDNGLIDIEEAIRTLNPDDDEEALQRKVGIARIERDKLGSRNSYTPDIMKNVSDETYIETHMPQETREKEEQK